MHTSANTKFRLTRPPRVHKYTQRRQRESDGGDEYLCVITAVALQGAGAAAHLATPFPIAAAWECEAVANGEEPRRATDELLHPRPAVSLSGMTSFSATAPPSAGPRHYRVVGGNKK